MVPQLFPKSNFSLPGGLLFDESLIECRRFETIAIHPLTGYEEDWLAQARDIPTAVVVTRLIDSCVVHLDGQSPPADFARRLLSGDRDYLVLQIRRLTLGDDVCAVASCPRCGKSMDVNFNAAAIPVDGKPQDATSYSIELDPREGVSARQVRFRLPVGADQEAAAEMAMEMDAAVRRLLSRCVLDDGGHPLTPEEESKVSEAMELEAPAIHLELDLTCPECDHAFLLPFDTTAFFFEEMRIGAQQLLKEVHSLAVYYHWSEAEILGLVRNRRRSYLALLRETVGEVH